MSRFGYRSAADGVRPLVGFNIDSSSSVSHDARRAAAERSLTVETLEGHTTMLLQGPALHAFESVCELVERLLVAADGLSAEQLDTAPWEGASTMFILAVHAVYSIEWHIVEVLAGEQLDRSRRLAFEPRAKLFEDPQALLKERWDGTKLAIESVLIGLSDDTWDRPHYHKFKDRNLSGYELINWALSHTAEHVGHAEMTRQWLDAQ